MSENRRIDQMLAWLIAIGLTLAVFAGFHFLTKNLRSIAEFDDETGKYGTIETSKGITEDIKEPPKKETTLEATPAPKQVESVPAEDATEDGKAVAPTEHEKTDEHNKH